MTKKRNKKGMTRAQAAAARDPEKAAAKRAAEAEAMVAYKKQHRKDLLSTVAMVVMFIVSIGICVWAFSSIGNM